MKTVTAIFLKGLAALLPLTITLAALHWLFTTSDELVGPLVEQLFPALDYRPWMGITSVFVLVFAVGLLMNAYLIRVLFELGEKLLQRIPLVKTLYGSVRDLMGFFSGDDAEQQMSQVVMVKVGDTQLRLLGLVTREDFAGMPEGIAREGSIAVYLPMSYQLGGFTAMIPREHVEPVDMSVEEAMRFAVTAGMTSKAQE